MEINLFHVLGENFTNALTQEERRQIDAISTRLSSDPNFKGLNAHGSSIWDSIYTPETVKAAIERTKAEAADAEDYRKSVEASFV